MAMRGFSEQRRRVLAIMAMPFLLLAYSAVSVSPAAKPCKRRASPEAETAALAYLRAQRYDAAIAVLEPAAERELTRAEPSLRLLDLLATVYARRGRVKELITLAAKAEAAAHGRQATALLERAGKWRDGQSKWRRDRASVQVTIKWRPAKPRPDDIIISA